MTSNLTFFSLRDGFCPSFVRTSSTQAYFVPRVVEFGPGVLDRKSNTWNAYRQTDGHTDIQLLLSRANYRALQILSPRLEDQEDDVKYDFVRHYEFKDYKSTNTCQDVLSIIDCHRNLVAKLYSTIFCNNNISRSNGTIRHGLMLTLTQPADS